MMTIGRRNPSFPRAQRGAVAIIVGLSLAVLVGAAGLALDSGKLYVTKAELQNSADACALAASYELTGSAIAPATFLRATDAGVTVATQNRVGFQGASIAAGNVVVTYGASLVSGASFLPATSNPPNNSKYVRCTITQSGIVPSFMQVLGAGTQTVNALATATLAPSQSNCAVPLAFCVNPAGASPAPTGPNWGYTVGKWYSMNFDDESDTSGDDPNCGKPKKPACSTGSTSLGNLTGNFRWIDFDPGALTPGCTGGGAAELACVLKGSGQCNLPPTGPATCSSSGNSTPAAGCVGQNGNIASLGKAYNTRFGIYHSGDGPANAPPDFTGLGYDSSNWKNASPENAYGGTASAGSGGTPNFKASRLAHTPAQASYAKGGASVTAAQNYITYGADRRLVTVPFVECAGFTGSGQHAPVRGYACALLTAPYSKSGKTVTVTAEYLGASNAAGSPCATSGAVGTSTSSGPLVPALVQ